jgi:phosphinothricin acetyltransferase
MNDRPPLRCDRSAFKDDSWQRGHSPPPKSIPDLVVPVSIADGRVNLLADLLCRVNISMDTITIRHASETDLPAILDIFNEAILNTTAVYEYQPHTLEMRQAWYDAKISQGFPIFVAETNQRIVGFSSLGSFRAWTAYKYTVENSIYVAADCRGQGIGKKLLAPLIQSAQEMEMHAIVAGIDASNIASHKLHFHFGFVEVAHFHQVAYKFGRWLDLKFLELILETPKHPRESDR